MAFLCGGAAAAEELVSRPGFADAVEVVGAVRFRLLEGDKVAVGDALVVVVVVEGGGETGLCEKGQSALLASHSPLA